MHSLPTPTHYQSEPPRPQPQPQAKPTQQQPPRRPSLGQIIEPDWLLFGLGLYSSLVTLAMTFRGSPVHGWMVANAKPIGWIAVCLMCFGLEKAFAHFTNSKIPRILFRSISLTTGVIALVVLLYYSQV
jgi:hypothetical protein